MLSVQYAQYMLKFLFLIEVRFEQLRAWSFSRIRTLAGFGQRPMRVQVIAPDQLPTAVKQYTDTNTVTCTLECIQSGPS